MKLDFFLFVHRTEIFMFLEILFLGLFIECVCCHSIKHFFLMTNELLAVPVSTSESDKECRRKRVVYYR